jgi:hypothetical protein
MTIDYIPTDFTSAYENIVVTAIDANWLLDANYKYICALSYWNGAAWVAVTSQQVRPDPTSGYGIFNFSKQCQGAFTFSKLDIHNAGFLEFDLGEKMLWLHYKVEVREEYLGTISAVLDTAEFYITNTYNIDYSIPGYDQFKKMFDGLAYGFGSNREQSQLKISKRSKYFFVPVINFSGSDPKSFAFEYNSTATAEPVPDQLARHINICVDSMTAEGFTIDYDTAKDLVIREDGGAATVIATLNYNVVCDDVSDHYVLHFLNSWGCYESFLFSKPSKKMVKREQKYFESKPYLVDGSGQQSIYEPTVYGAFVRVATKKAYNTEYTETITLKSDFVSDKDYRWLKELINSSSIYCSINDSTVLLPVTITNNNYEEKTYITNKLTQLSIDIELEQTFKSHIR